MQTIEMINENSLDDYNREWRRNSVSLRETKSAVDAASI